MLAARRLLVLAGPLVLTACAALIGLERGTPVDVLDAAPDVAAIPSEAAAPVDVAQPPVDAAPDADVPIDYYDLADATRWSRYDLAGRDTQAVDFGAAVYLAAARKIYFLPYGQGFPGRFVVLDVDKDFASDEAWTFFDLSISYPYARGILGAVTDGRTIFAAPHYVNFGGASKDWSGYATRIDTDAGIADGGVANASITVLTNDPQARGFYGAVFDGRWAYFVPHFQGYSHGHTARWDTTGPIDAPASYQVFDLGALPMGTTHNAGGVFDGRYVYYVPNLNSVTVRFDTTKSFLSAASYESFALNTINARAATFLGGVFDGRYVYYVPHGGQNLAVRYDTTLPFSDAGSFEPFDPLVVHPNASGFGCGAYDGRYVYFAPYYGSTVLRYDTRAAWGESASWSAIDLSSLDGGAVAAGAFRTVTFDGEHLYFAPSTGTSSVYRFHARSKGPLPPTYRGSFL